MNSSFFDEAQIEGQVAKIDDEYTVVINRGKIHGVTPGMIFAIYDDETEAVRDPETDESLDVPIEKLRVKVFDVFSKACRAATFQTNSPISNMLKPSARLSRLITGRDRIENEQLRPDERPIGEVVVTVNIGDTAKSVAKGRME
ncbi:hypothetical protein [Gordonia sp. (in: high G+C Gram-positive bacteria)]|uniref:hypothetical protein n=1 Tax=Gordonia sp. (in: high G+C Gram-positive bacteria) TaxID=84139 RepID=UPI0039E3A076